MQNEKQFKPKKIEILGVIVLFLLVGVWTVPKVTGTQELFVKPFAFSQSTSLQQSVDQYYYDNVKFPAQFQPTVGFPSDINLTLLGKANPNRNNSFMVDAYGKVFILPNTFLPPNEVELIYDSKGKTYLRWAKVQDADGYGIRKMANDNTAMMNKAFGKISASLLNVSSKGEEIVSSPTDKFVKDGDYLLFPISELKDGDVYVVYAYSDKYGETPEVTVGYHR